MRWEHSYCRGHRRTSLDKRLVSLAAHFTCSSGRVFLHCGPMSKSLLVNQERRRERRDPSCRKWEEAALAAAQSNQPQIRLDAASLPRRRPTDRDRCDARAPLSDRAARCVARYRGKKRVTNLAITASNRAQNRKCQVSMYHCFLLVFRLLRIFGIPKSPLRNVL